MSPSRSRPSGPVLLIGVVLSIVVGSQLWLLYRVETALRSPDTATPVGVSANAAGADPDRDVLNRPDPLLDALARIESRLVALEVRRESPSGAAAVSPQPVVAGSREALAADRELAAMLPPQPMSMPDLFALQGRIGTLPAAQQQQLSAALARAVNSGRVQVRQE